MWIHTYTHINTKEVERSYIIKRSYVTFKQYYFPAAVFSNTLSSPEDSNQIHKYFFSALCAIALC